MKIFKDPIFYLNLMCILWAIMMAVAIVFDNKKQKNVQVDKANIIYEIGNCKPAQKFNCHITNINENHATITCKCE